MSYHTRRLVTPMLAPMTKRAAPRSSDFGQRLRRLRQTKDLTQQQVADVVGCTQRAMVYYEKEGKLPPAVTTAKMAALFGVTVEELLDNADAPATSKRPTIAPDLLHNPDDRRLWRQFQRLKKLPDHDQSTVLRILNSLADARASSV